MEYPSINLSNLAGIYSDFAYSKVLKFISAAKIEFKEHTFAYLQQKDKNIIFSSYTPKNDIEAIAVLYFEIKKYIKITFSKYLEYLTFRYNGISTRGYYEYYSSFLDQYIKNLTDKLNKDVFSFKDVDLDKMFLIYDKLMYLNTIFDQLISEDFDHKLSSNFNIDIKMFTYNPYWYSKDIEYHNILNKKFEIQDDVEIIIYKKSENAVELEL